MTPRSPASQAAVDQCAADLRDRLAAIPDAVLASAADTIAKTIPLLQTLEDRGCEAARMSLLVYLLAQAKCWEIAEARRQGAGDE